MLDQSEAARPSGTPAARALFAVAAGHAVACARVSADATNENTAATNQNARLDMTALRLTFDEERAANRAKVLPSIDSEAITPGAILQCCPRRAGSTSRGRARSRWSWPNCEI